MVINSSGSYQLINDITNSDSNICIDITDAPNVVFDGNGHTIQGKFSQGSIAIRIFSQHVTIKNTKLRDWDTGIRSEEKYNTIESNDASNLVTGVIIRGQYGEVKDNTFNNNDKIGISVEA